MSVFNRFMSPPASAEVTAKRREVCATCEFKRHIKVVNKDVCGACGCPILAKTSREFEKCPKGKW